MISKFPIYVTRPYLASLEEYIPMLKEIWSSNILTNGGQYVNEFEALLGEKFKAKHAVTFPSGTTALHAAIKSLKVKGEIITTPFTWIATITAIKLESCEPVFCDIDKETFNLDASKLENHITPNTKAIMPVHVFGNPCNVNEIELIAKKYDVPVIYDAAHSVGSKVGQTSVLNFGDASAVSFHATKIINTGGEGGAVFTSDDFLAKNLKRVRFFGYNEDKTDIVENGLNGKLSEIQSSLGILNLKVLDQIINQRKNKYSLYINNLKNIDSLKFQKFSYGEPNYSYFPIIFQNEKSLIKITEALNKQNIFPRRYFYPSVNTFEKVVESEKKLESEYLAKRILCLPLFYDLEDTIINSICNVINDGL